MELAVETRHWPCKSTLEVNCSKIFVAIIDGLLNPQYSLIPQFRAEGDFVNNSVLKIVGSCRLFMYIARRTVLDSCRHSVQLTRHCVNPLFLWGNNTNQARYACFCSFLNLSLSVSLSLSLSLSHTHTHTHTHTHPAGLLWTNDQLFREAATYTTRYKHKRRTSVPSASFEPSILVVKMDEIIEERRKKRGDEVNDLYTSPDIIHMIR